MFHLQTRRRKAADVEDTASITDSQSHDDAAPIDGDQSSLSQDPGAVQDQNASQDPGISHDQDAEGLLTKDSPKFDQHDLHTEVEVCLREHNY